MNCHGVRPAKCANGSKNLLGTPGEDPQQIAEYSFQKATNHSNNLRKTENLG
jgi:hypothetical protein